MDDKFLAKQLINNINRLAVKDVKIMEVCGTHTQMISKLGLRSVLSPNIKLLSGPGCPVCVTDEEYIDKAIQLLNNYPVTIATFGDLMRVRGSEGSLLDEKGKGRDVRVVYSPIDLIHMTEGIRDSYLVFLSVGFETSAPVMALTIKTAMDRGIKNLFFLTSLKLMEPVLHYILKDPDSRVQGLICPGHVASVMGSDYFRFVSKEYGIPAAVCGFEALDILGGIHYLVKHISQSERGSFINLYRRCVKPEGNTAAKELMDEVFEISNGNWRGIGPVENSFLRISEKYCDFDAEKRFWAKGMPGKKTNKCECGDILLGKKAPRECRLFARLCSPQNPVGPCMVSTEGACAIAYKYREGI